MLNLGGYLGFLIGIIFGFFGQVIIICCQEWRTNLSFLWGSLGFLMGSYLMISFQIEYLLVNCLAFKLDIRALENKLGNSLSPFS